MADTSHQDAQGSVWRRWDPHIHAPGTVLADQFGSDSFDAYLDILETASPTVEALGATDYYGTTCYERVAAAQAAGRLQNLLLIFPNIEMRLSLGTKAGSGVNLHLLVSPDDPDHLIEVQRFLRRLEFKYRDEKYSCVREELIRLGRRHDPAQTDDSGAFRVGVNQFKVDFVQLRAEYEDSIWAQANVLIAVAAATSDGTAGLRDADASFAAQRQEVESFAHIVLSSNEGDQRFWAGEGALDPAAVKRQYRSLKPCIHGSDAHRLERTARPNGDRFTWIKGDPTFESLRQACIEPRARVAIGADPPSLGSAERAIISAKTIGAPWFIDDAVPLNPGLVAIIGARGSGKTALADTIAHGAGSPAPLDNERSFLRRASSHLTGTTVELEWTSGDETRSVASLDRPVAGDWPASHYLSQQFVERLCSSESPTDELLQEIHKVVFAAHDATTRLGATDFAELLDEKLGDMQLQRQDLRDRLDRLTDNVLTELERKRAIPVIERQVAQVSADLKADEGQRGKLLGRGTKVRRELYERLHAAITERERALQALDQRQQSLLHLKTQTERIRDQLLPDYHRQLVDKYQAAGLSDEAWREFEPVFRGDPIAVLRGQLARTNQELTALAKGTSANGPTQQTTIEQLAVVDLAVLRAAAKTLGEEIGIDEENAKKLNRLDERIASRRQELQKRNQELLLFQGYPDRLQDLAARRQDAYRDVFALLESEDRILHDLYGPLEVRLRGRPSVDRLELTVARSVDLPAWAARGELLLDLRKQGAFRGQGALAEIATKELLPAWEGGSADRVAAAMSDFRSRYDADLLTHALVAEDDPEYRKWTLQIGQWLYSTDHIAVNYSFEYEGLPLGQLSPGTRGIVLLLLFLALDQDDNRPLIIDQPEENLDPRSVYDELVDLFREARQRRQVIVVTHNANLVVNTDVDQVIVATCTKAGSGKPPQISYLSGGLENPVIRREVCEILEGGEEAFRERARRLRVTLPAATRA